MGLTDRDIEKIKDIFSDQFLNNIAEKVMQIIDRKYKEKFKAQEKAIGLLQQEIDDLKNSKRQAEDAFDNLEQASRSLNIRVFGVPINKNENLHSKMIDIFNKNMNVNIDASHIKKCHRITSRSPGDKPPAVLVRFVNDIERTAVLKNRKYLKSTGIQVKEDLTKNRLTLLSEAIKRFSSKQAWCFNGVVYVKIGDKVHRVSHSDELKNLK